MFGRSSQFIVLLLAVLGLQVAWATQKPRSLSIDYKRCHMDPERYRCYLPKDCSKPGANLVIVVEPRLTNQDCDRGVSLRSVDEKLIEVEVQYKKEYFQNGAVLKFENLPASDKQYTGDRKILAFSVKKNGLTVEHKEVEVPRGGAEKLKLHPLDTWTDVNDDYLYSRFIVEYYRSDTNGSENFREWGFANPIGANMLGFKFLASFMSTTMDFDLTFKYPKSLDSCTFSNILFSGKNGYQGFQAVKPAYILSHNIFDLSNACPPTYVLRTDRKYDEEVTAIKCESIKGTGEPVPKIFFKTSDPAVPEKTEKIEGEHTLTCLKRQEGCTSCNPLLMSTERFKAPAGHEPITYDAGEEAIIDPPKSAVCPTITCKAGTQFYNELDGDQDTEGFISDEYPSCKYDVVAKEWKWMVKSRRGLKPWDTKKSYCRTTGGSCPPLMREIRTCPKGLPRCHEPDLENGKYICTANGAELHASLSLDKQLINVLRVECNEGTSEYEVYFNSSQGETLLTNKGSKYGPRLTHQSTVVCLSKLIPPRLYNELPPEQPLGSSIGIGVGISMFIQSILFGIIGGIVLIVRKFKKPEKLAPNILDSPVPKIEPYQNQKGGADELNPLIRKPNARHRTDAFVAARFRDKEIGDKADEFAEKTCVEPNKQELEELIEKEMDNEGTKSEDPTMKQVKSIESEKEPEKKDKTDKKEPTDKKDKTDKKEPTDKKDKTDKKEPTDKKDKTDNKEPTDKKKTENKEKEKEDDKPDKKK